MTDVPFPLVHRNALASGFLVTSGNPVLWHAGSRPLFDRTERREIRAGTYLGSHDGLFYRGCASTLSTCACRRPTNPFPCEFMISIVVPLLNEQDSLAELYRQIESAIVKDGLGPFEVILVDDGSRDESWSVVEELVTAHRTVVGIRFRRNFGKAAALAAGFRAARGELVVTMDADLQDDPNELRALVTQLQSGFDLVSGWKQRRFDPWHKTIPSRVFNGILRRFSHLQLHDFNCGLKILRRSVVEELPLYGEMHRFIPVFAAARGFRVAEIAVHHRPRMHGVSKYGISRNVKGFLDLLTVLFLTRYRQRPLHLFGGIALGCIAGALGLLLVSLVSYAVQHATSSGSDTGWLSVVSLGVAALLALMAVQCIGHGLVAEFVVANAEGRLASYSIAEHIGATVETMATSTASNSLR